MCHIIPHDCIKKESKYSEKHIQNVHFWICVISLWWHHIHHVFLKNILKFGSKTTKWFWNISVKYIGKNANQIFFGRVSQSGASNYFGLVGWEMQLPGWLFHSSFFAFHYDFLFISIYCSHKPNQVTHTHSAEWLRYDKLHTEDDDPHTSYLVTLFKASDSGDVSKKDESWVHHLSCSFWAFSRTGGCVAFVLWHMYTWEWVTTNDWPAWGEGVR